MVFFFNINFRKRIYLESGIPGSVERDPGYGSNFELMAGFHRVDGV